MKSSTTALLTRSWRLHLAPAASCCAPMGIVAFIFTGSFGSIPGWTSISPKW